MLSNVVSRAPTGYTIFCDFNDPLPGRGLATIIRNDIPHYKININSHIQTTAFRISLDRQYTICNIYLSPGEVVNLNDLTNIIEQLPAPLIIGGDFNSHHPLWDSLCLQPDAKSRVIEAALLQTSIAVINNGNPTHFHTQTNSHSAIDLTLCSADISRNIIWTIDEDLHSSDHYPIVIEIENNEDYVLEKRFIEERADWARFERETHITYDENFIEDQSIEMLVDAFNEHIMVAAINSIPQSSNIPRPRRNPWWTQECNEAIRKRKTALRKYQRSSLIIDKINYCRARAIATNTLKNAKKNSWRKYISSININTPMSKIWKRIGKIRGSYQNIKTPYLIKNNVHISDRKQVAELFATHYENISSVESYTHAFRRSAINIERRPINFNTMECLAYNTQITSLEFSRMLATAKKSAPGQDRISYNMLGKINPSCKQLLLEIMNKVFDSGIYPPQWKSSVVLSFPKLGKDHTSEQNFRPISLTSCVGKLLEKIVNTRLNIVLEKNNHIPPQQFGFRQMQSTTDALNKFTTDVADALNRKEQVVCVSFDLRKAYDTTWRHGILLAMSQLGLKGKLPILIKEFLADRTFVTKIGDVTSQVHRLDQGVPQGSVLSCRLFSLAINGILANIPNDVEGILYVDDLLIYCQGSYAPSLERRIQNTINKINTWAINHGFTFSAEKTQCIHFHCKRKFQPPLKLTMNGRIIPCRESIKYLGMTVDYKLNWIAHIKNLKMNCMKALDILKCLANTNWGSDRTTMLRLYRALIRSKLDYGCFIYNSAKESTLKLLDPVHNAAIRLCTGAYRSSPVESLYVESGEASLQNRRMQLILQYHARTMQLETSCAYPYADIDNHEMNENPGRIKTVKDKILSCTTATSMSITTMPFSFPATPVWQLRPSTLCKEYIYPKKENCSPVQMRQLFKEHYEIYHRHQFAVYTDGAKNDDGAGSSAVSLGGKLNMKLKKQSSIFTAELCGILCGLKIISRIHDSEFVLFCDSRSALHVVEHYDSTHPLISKIVRWIIRLERENKCVHFCWCPSHVGIAGNENADIEATAACRSDMPVNNDYLPYRDWYPAIRDKVRETWQNEWMMKQENKLRQVKDSVRPWKSIESGDRRQSIILTRLRIGHTKLTHQYLMEGGVQPYCEDCLVPYTIKHIIAECPSQQDNRVRIYPCTEQMSAEEALKAILSEDADGHYDISKISSLLNAIDIYSDIL